MTILLHKPYLVKVATMGGQIPKILTTWFMDDPQSVPDRAIFHITLQPVAINGTRHLTITVL